MSRTYNAFDSNSQHQPVLQTSLLSRNNEKLDSQITQATATNTKLDQLSGAINNNIGDASVKLQTYIYGHDAGNGLARPLAVTSNGELKVSNDVLEVSAETVNLNTDTLEAKIQATNDKIDSLSGAGNNNVGEGSTKLQTYLYGRDVGNGLFRPLVCDSDAHLQVDVLSTALPTGGATEATLNDVKTSVQLMDDVVTAQNAAHPSKANAVGGRYYVDNTFRDLRVDNIGKLIIDTPSGSDLHNAVTHHLTQNGDGTGNKAGVILDAINTNTITQNNNQTNGNQITKIMGSEDATTGGTQRQIHVDGNGNIQTSIVNTIFQQPSNSTNSHITDDPANSVAVGLKARTTQGTATSEVFLISDNDGKQIVKSNTNRSYGSEVSYVSGQSVSGSGSHTGASITLDANVKALYVEHNFSHTGIKYEILGSIDGSTFLNTGVFFNAGGMSPATLTGLSTILGTSSGVEGFPPHIKFEFTNSDSSAQTATLSYVIQTH